MGKIDVDDYLQELVELQRQNSELGLLQFDNIISASQYRLLYDLSQTFLPAQSRILDWGCGNGHFSYYLIRRGFEVSIYSLENLPPLLLGIEKGQYKFTQGKVDDPVTIPFPDGSFDAVVSVGVLEHVRETRGSEQASLEEIRRILRPDGIFIGYHLPNKSSWIEALSAIIPNKHSHRWRYSRKILRQLLRNSGFDVKWLARYGFLPRWAVNRLPVKLKESKKAADIYCSLDALLVKILPFLSTNHVVIATKAIDQSSLRGTK